MIITSLKNPGVKLARSLRNRNAREEYGLSVLEGFRAVSRGLDCGIEMTDCYFCPDLFLGENESGLIARIAERGTRVQEVAPHILAKIAYRDRPEGIIALMKIKEHSLEQIPVKKYGLYVVAESIEKPGNLGSILRSADAVNADGVIVCAKRTDIYNPNVITASTGALFSANLAETSAEKAFDWFKKNDILTIAATPEAEKIYSDVDLTKGIAIVVGTEQYGLSDFWKSRADINVRIPMMGFIDSLNVATATTVIMYEAARQRNWNDSIESNKI